MSRAPLLAIVAVLALAEASHAQRPATQHAWQVYRNERFGFGLRYPADIFRPARASAAGDGQIFESRDGSARLLVGAFPNTERHTPAAYQQYIARRSYAGYAIDYSRAGRSWAVLSGENQERIFYEKVFFRCGGAVVNSFAIVYPRAQRRLYDAIVEGIENSFLAGSHSCSQARG